jgi:hypothetical protein
MDQWRFEPIGEGAQFLGLAMTSGTARNPGMPEHHKQIAGSAAAC